MKDLYTKVVVPVSEKKIEYGSKILLLGSCFAENIGEKFGENYFQAIVNPFGTLYNPASIMNAITLSLAGNTEHNILAHNGLWHSMMHHGSFSHPNKDEVIHCCQTSLSTLRQALHDASIIIITFGTAWVYEYAGKVVGNCHKIPANQFVRRRMTVEEIVATWQPLVEAMPDKKWLFTVSPIRHVKDGLHENHINKGILLQAVEQLTKQSGCSYFPAYEIMLDELRDYRYYAEDMVHPSFMAVEYIWQRLVETYMTADTQAEMKTLHQLWRDEHHRFIHPDSMEAKRFLERLEQKKHELQEDYPWIE